MADRHGGDVVRLWRSSDEHKQPWVSYRFTVDGRAYEGRAKIGASTWKALQVGSTLQVYPVAGLVPTAKESGARVVILNAEPTPFDRIADAVLSGSISDVLSQICQD